MRFFFKDLIKEISKSESKYKKVKLGKTDALNVQWFEVWQENTVYNRTIFFFEKCKSSAKSGHLYLKT